MKTKTNVKSIGNTLINQMCSCSYNIVFFYGRRFEKKAMPVVLLLLFLLPVNISAATNICDNDTVKTTNKSRNSKVLARAKFEHGMSNGATVDIEFISTDGNDDDFEIISVTNNTFLKPTIDGKLGRRNLSSTVHVDTLKTEHVTQKFDDGSTNKYERYYIKGEGSFYKSRVLSDSGEILDSSMSFNKVPKGSLAISKEFYDYLKNIMGNDVQYKSEDVEEKGYLPLDVEDYF